MSFTGDAERASTMLRLRRSRIRAARGGVEVKGRVQGMLTTETAYGTGRLRCGFGRRATGRAPILALLGVVAGGLLGARPVRAVTVTLPSAGDSWIDEGAQNTNKGTDGHMHVLSTVSKLRRGVIQSDLSSIPACASVTSATLRMTIENAGNASRTYGAHRVTASWTEGGVTWLRRNSTTLWTSAGGDFVAAPTDSVPTGTTKTVFLEWNVTPDVAAYVSGAAGNFGWLVKDEAENVGKIEFLLRNREDGDGPTPELVVTYTLTDTPACDDGSGCTTDTCDFAGCHYTPVADGTECNDGDGCTQTDTCQAGTCTGGTPVACPAPDQCHDAGTCNPGTGLCSNPSKADGTGCNDGDACTLSDTCQGGTCTAGNSVTCPAPDQCHDAGTCNPSTGLCWNASKADGTGCHDGDACTLSDTCQGGTCTAGNSVTCPAPDQCHDAGTCNPGTGLCSNPSKADGTGCNDGDACTLSDTCQGGTCTAGNSVTCPAPDQCHDAGTCNPGSALCSNPSKPDGTGGDD